MVIENYYNPDKCEELKNEINRLLIENSDKIEADAEGSDYRLFGAERISDMIKSFYDDFFIRQIGETYSRTGIINYMTLAARQVYKPGNKGSGGGWHRDSANEQQFKSIIYLSDVTSENGPYQYVDGSHNLLSCLRSFSFEKQKRFSEEDLDAFVKKFKLTVSTLTSGAGTLILTDTRGIHRGMPIKRGERFALTNYFVAGHRQESFKTFFNHLLKFPDRE